MPLAGGIVQHGYQCGMLWGAALAAGAEAHKKLGPGPSAETQALLAAQKLVAAFQNDNHSINCFDITQIDKTATTLQMMVYFFLKGGVVGCLRRAARYAPMAFEEINQTLSTDLKHTPTAPVSCSAELARRMGASELHTVMAAGFAGGIGLCGGGCGALGAAIWLTALANSEDENPKLDFADPRILDIIERFLHCTGNKFECAEIVGRKFEGLTDHSEFVQQRGCAHIIEVLSSPQSGSGRDT